jgi:large subunit ribosomal protein L18e
MKFNKKMTTNPRLIRLIIACEKTKSKMWKEIARRLAIKRRRAEVNVSKIDRYAKEGETIVVPGVVLGNGNITKKVKVAALRFSKSAKEKLLNSGCEVLTLEELLIENPEGKNTRIMG